MVGPKNSGLTENFYTEYNKICAKIKSAISQALSIKGKRIWALEQFQLRKKVNSYESPICSQSKKKKLERNSKTDWETNQFFANVYFDERFSIQPVIIAWKILWQKWWDDCETNKFFAKCIFMKGFRFNLLSLLVKFDGRTDVKKIIPSNVKLDIQIWRKAIKGRHGPPCPWHNWRPLTSEPLNFYIWCSRRCTSIITRNYEGS